MIIPFVMASWLLPGCSESNTASAPPQLPPTQRATAVDPKKIKDVTGKDRSNADLDSTLHPTK
jgi:hypothetical protein